MPCCHWRLLVCAGSFATIRQRRLASPTSILEIEATHPHVKPSLHRCVIAGRPREESSSYSPRRASPSACRHRRFRVRRADLRQGAAGRAGRRHARGPAELPPVHAAPLPGGELPPEPVGDHGAASARCFRGAANVRYRQGDVTDVDLENKEVHLSDGTTLEYDKLVLATGSITNYYGNQAVEAAALGLKDLGEALQLRNHVLDCLEQAAIATDADERRRLLTFCIVGGGPTGVEFAGALAELVRLVLPHEYPEFPPSDVRIVLLEGGDRVLPTFKKRLSKYARHELQVRGVDVRHRDARRVGRRAGRRDARRIRAADRVDRVDRGRATVSPVGASGCHAHGTGALRRRRPPPHPGCRRRLRDRRRRRPRPTTAVACSDALAARDAGRPVRRA